MRSLPPSTESKTPKTRTVSKCLPRGVWDPPIPDPEKSPKKSEKSRKSLKINYFLDFSDFFGTFSGSGIGGPKTPLGRLFETFRVFRVLDSVDGGRDLNFSMHLQLWKCWELLVLSVVVLERFRITLA